MLLYPAIDLRGGHVVRLHQGDFTRETVYGNYDDAVTVAESFAAAGARWIHVVDLDAARTGEPLNRSLVARIAAAVAPDIRVQAGGGVRTVDAAEALFDAGVHRVVMGTAAVEQPDLVRRVAGAHPVAVGIDTRAGEVMVRGWTAGSGRKLEEVLDALEHGGVEAVVITDIGRDATMRGPDIDGLSKALGATTLDVVASGGVGTLGHLSDLATVEIGGRRLAGAIVGKAIHDGRMSVGEAIEACAGLPSE